VKRQRPGENNGNKNGRDGKVGLHRLNWSGPTAARRLSYTVQYHLD
jgi:hypothetical protein